MHLIKRSCVSFFFCLISLGLSLLYLSCQYIRTEDEKEQERWHECNQLFALCYLIFQSKQSGDRSRFTEYSLWTGNF